MEHTSICILGNNSNDLSTLLSQISPDINAKITTAHQTDYSALEQICNSCNQILIVFLEQSNAVLLKHISEILPSSRPALLVIATENNSELMRKAMQAGARDYFIAPYNIDEINNAVISLQQEFDKQQKVPGTLTTVINAKGGSGASLVACNLAHITAVTSCSRTALIDLDLQFGTQALLLDIKPEHTIIDTLNDIDNIDNAALDGYMSRHDSGLNLLSTLHEHIVLPGEIPVSKLDHLLSLSLKNYDHVFIDLPRLIDPLTATVLDSSDHVLIVLQQSLAHLRDAKRLVQIIKSELNVPSNKITLVVNRFDPDNSIQNKDILSALGCSHIVSIPNDYDRVATATNLGIPLFQYAQQSKIAESFIHLAEQLGITVGEKFKQQSFFKRLFK